MALVLGSIGEEMDLLIRQGGTFGPHIFTMKNADGVAFNLTGVTIRGSIRKDPTSTVSYPIVYTMVDMVGGVYSMTIPATTTTTIKAGATLTNSESKYAWDSEMEDALGNVTPLYYGKVSVQREITRV